MNSALILIDIQNDYNVGGKYELHNMKAAVGNAKTILEQFRKNKQPVFHIQHINKDNSAPFFVEGSSGADIIAMVAPIVGERVIQKNTPDCFFHTSLHELLCEEKINHLVIAGMMSHMCIDTSVRTAKSLGYQVTLIEDACTTRDLSWNNTVYQAQTVHEIYMASLKGIFADIQCTEQYTNS